MKFKSKFLKGIVVMALSCVVLSGCGKKEKVEVYYTTDLHSHFTKALEEELSKRDRDNTLLVDAGDIVDIQTQDDTEWMTGEKTHGLMKDFNGRIIEKIAAPLEGLAPVGQKMKEYGYDMAAIGNHEFYGGYEEFKKLIKSFNEANIPLMSANTFYTKEEAKSNEDKRVSDPYMIKNIKSSEGDVKVGIIPLTTTTVNDEKPFKNGQIKFDKKIMLQYNPDYNGKMYMTDMVDEAKKVSKLLKEKENPDVVMMVVHSGEQPKIPRHTGNRVKELAEQVPNIDVIIGGHTHTVVELNKYKGVDGKTVYYTQSGNHSKQLGKAEIYLKKDGDKWKVANVETDIKKLKVDKNDPEDAANEIAFKYFSKAEYEKLQKINPNVYIDYTLVFPNKKVDLPIKTDKYEIYHRYDIKDKDYSQTIYYLKSKNYDDAYNTIKKYNPEMIEAYKEMNEKENR